MTIIDIFGMLITLTIWALISFTVLAIIPKDEDDDKPDTKGELE